MGNHQPKAKNVFGILDDLDKSLSDVKENPKLLQNAESEKRDEHADPDRLRDQMYQINEKLKKAAEDFAKYIMEKWQYCETINGDASRHGKDSPKGPAAKKRKVEIQLYCAQKTDITDIAMRELEKHLTSEQFHQGMILTVKTIKTGSSISAGIPLIVICLNSSRLGVDFSNAVSEVPDRSNTVVLIFHLLKEHALPTQPSNTVLTKAEVTKVGTIIDVAFLEDIGLYDCKMNRSAYKALLTFIKKHWCKTSAGGSEGKELEQPPARRPSPSPKPPPSPAPLSRPWREPPPLNLRQLLELQKRVENYSLPHDLKVKQARILLLGPAGAGKCSFFKTINSFFQGQFLDSTKDSLAMQYRQYEVRSSRTMSPLNFRLCVTCGVEKDKGPDLEQLNYLLEGNVPEGYTFSSTPISPNINDFIHEPEPGDKVHCLVFLFDASSVKATDQDTWDKLNQLQDRTNAKGIPKVIVLTKIDKLLESADNDVSTVFFSKDVERAVKYASGKLSVPIENVMPIKNYENENDLNDQISCLALQALDRMLDNANGYLVRQHVPM